MSKAAAIIKKFLSKNTSDEITYEELDSFEIGKEERLYENDTVVFERLKPNKANSIYFRVFMQEGSEYKPHLHDCKERIILHSGLIYDNITKKIVKRLEELILPEHSVHHIQALKDAFFYVEFTKPS